jgi:1-acyl-sn-glycerol-3-phosphate acyltransferase
LAWRDVVFPIAAGDVFFQHRGLAAFATACLNALPIWRRKTGAHEMQQLRQRLTQPPCVYILFPEGARTRTGQMLRFKSGVGRLVAGTTVPVVPAYLKGTFEAGPAGAVFPRPYKIVLRIGKPIDCSGVADESNGWKEVARRVEEEIYRLGGLTPPARETGEERGEGTEDPGLAS